MNEPTDHEDRLVDLALTEIVGGQTPPDLSARIAAALAANSTSQLTPSLSMNTKLSKSRWSLYAVAASIALVTSVVAVTSTVNNAFVAKGPAARGLAQAKQEVATSSIDTEFNKTSPLAAKPVAPASGPAHSPVNSSGANDEARLRMMVTPGIVIQSAEGEKLARGEQLKLQEPQESMSLADGVAPETEGATLGVDARNLSDIKGGLPPQIGRQSAAGGQFAFRSQPAKPAATAPASGAGQTVPSPYYMTDDLDALSESAAVPADRFAGDTAGVRYREMSSAAGSELDERNFDWSYRRPGLQALGDKYDAITENAFIETRGEQALSTFSIDVDTASYANVRQFLVSGQLPPPDAVRLEELINYFDYHYAGPPSSANRANDTTPFAAHLEVAACPWAPAHRLVRIGVKGRDVQRDKRPLSNLVFLVDVSGSMAEPNKLPLVRHGLMQLARQLGENDRVAIVVYASSEGLVLDSTLGSNQQTILSALEKLEAGGSTAGGAGIQLAYQIAEDHFIPNGVNRVILCTDGDFNVGVTNTADLQRMVEQKAKDTKVSLSVLGFGRGNLNDTMMQTIANNGNGEHYYIDTEREAQKVFVDGLSSTLVTIAKDVKIQVEFNPTKVAGYRLLGYENRLLAAQDFNNDAKDAGEIGAGHTVTALYEIIPAGQQVPTTAVDALKYQQPAVEAKAEAAPTPTTMSDELLTLKMRYKQPTGDVSQKLEWPLRDAGASFASATPDFQFAAAVASFGMQLRNSQYKGDASYNAVIELATPGAKEDEHGYRAEFLELVRKARDLTRR